MHIKAKDIAAELGVSPATVSLALNNRPGINPGTKEKILSYVRQKEKELWSEPLSSSKGKIMVLNYIKNGTIMEHTERRQKMAPDRQGWLYREMASLSARQGYEMILRNFRENTQSLEQLLRECQKLSIKGIYIMAAEMQHSDI